MNINVLNEKLIAHKKWLNGEEGGKQADFTGANLRWADLSGADLRRANLRKAYLFWADLRETKLSGANLLEADFYQADLSRANLFGTNLYRADFSGANLFEANLCEADLRGANLCGAKNVPELPWLSIVPECGSFIGWKKVNSYIIKLKILEDAKRSNATGRKCRCSAAEVLEIQNIDGTKADIDRIRNNNYAEADYVVGEIVTPDSFDDDRWNECSHGIHFFITRQEAVEYI